MTGTGTYRSRKKRILFGTTVGMSALALLRGQLAWFREQGWEVTLVASPDPESQRAVEREQVSFFGIPMQRNISLLHDLRSSVEWMRLMRRIRPHAVNLGTPKASLLGSLAAWIWRVPRRIYTVRGLRLEGSSGFMEKLLWVMERLTIKMSTDVIVVSPSLGKELVYRKLAAPEDIWLIGSGSSNGVDVPAIQNRIVSINKDRLRIELGLDPTSFVVGYIGRVSSSKGVDTLLTAIRSARLVDNVELLVIGSIEESALGKSMEELGDRLRLIPWTDDVWGHLPAMDLLCLPTLREGFPNAVLEAAAAGIPAITTRATGAIDSVIDGETGFLIDVGDVDALVARLNLLAGDEKLTRMLGSNAKDRAERYFYPPRIWRGIEAIADNRKDRTQNRRLEDYMRGQK